MSYPVAVHCDSCAARFEARRPAGRIFLNRPGRGRYHLAITEGYEEKPATVCGALTSDYNSTIGTIGVELSADDLCHPWLSGLEACHQCFANVW